MRIFNPFNIIGHSFWLNLELSNDNILAIVHLDN